MPNVLIFDDHTIMRKGLKQILADREDSINLDEACNWPHALAKVHYFNYDLFLLSVSMLNKGGMSVLKKLKARRPQLPIILLTRNAEESDVERALSIGVRGYLTKRSSVDEMVCAMRKVLNGGTYFSNSQVDNLQNTSAMGSEITRYWNISRRDYQKIAPVRKAASTSPSWTDYELVQQRFEEIWGYFPTLHEVEKCLVETAMRIAGNNQGIAANMLGLKRQTLNMRLSSGKYQQEKIRNMSVDEVA